MQDVEVEITLTGGRSFSSVLPSNSPLLHDLFVSLASGPIPDPQNTRLILQLPLQNGEAACSFLSTSLVSVVTKPAVLIQPRQDESVYIERRPAVPAYVCIEDFLTPDENDQLLDYALANEQHFEASSIVADAGHTEVATHRRSKVLFAIRESRWRDVLVNRLKLHVPHIAATLGRRGFSYDSIEVQLTASNDGDFFKRHADTDHNHETVADRVITFVYYLHKTPKPFSGGNLLLYGDTGQPAHDVGGNVTAVVPENNSLVAFSSNLWHEVDMVRCPSGAFSDSRFTINGWLRGSAL